MPSTVGPSPVTTKATTVHLAATYTSPNTSSRPTTLSSISIALSTANTTQTRTSYLRALRAATTSLQTQINTELTARMEHDSNNAVPHPQKEDQVAKRRKTTEDAEEENYGEEVVDGDELGSISR